MSKQINATIMKGAAPEFYKGEKDIGFSLIHGFTGSPEEMKWIGRALADLGYTVDIPRLPGHGTSPYDMVQYNHEDWLREARKSYEKVKVESKIAYIAGLSMGAVITIILGNEFKVDKIIPISPPYKLHRTYLSYPLLPFKKVISIPSVKDNGVADPAVRENRANYEGFLPLANLPHLVKMMKLGRESAAKYSGDVLLIQGKLDTTFSFTQAFKWQKSFKNASCKLIVMEKSSHCVTIDYDKENTLNAILDFIN